MDEARKHEILARLLRRNAALEREIARQAEGSKIVADRMKQMETCAIVIAGRFEHEEIGRAHV